jgi:hypothetical protein
VVVLGAIVLSMAFMTLVALVRATRGTLADACAFFMAAIFLVVLGFGDTQQRYSLLIAPSMAIIVAVTLFPSRAAAGIGETSEPRHSGEPLHSAALRDRWWTCAGLGLIMLLYFACKPIAAAVALRLPQPLAQARQEDGPVACTSGPVMLHGDYKRLRATPAAEVTCFTISVPLPPAARSVSFFLSRDELLFPFEPRTPSPYRVRVEQDGKVIYEGELGREIVQWQQANLPHSTAPGDRLRFIVRSARPGIAEPFNVWWLTTSSRPVP